MNAFDAWRIRGHPVAARDGRARAALCRPCGARPCASSPAARTLQHAALGGGADRASGWRFRSCCCRTSSTRGLRPSCSASRTPMPTNSRGSGRRHRRPDHAAAAGLGRTAASACTIGCGSRPVREGRRRCCSRWRCCCRLRPSRGVSRPGAGAAGRRWQIRRNLAALKRETNWPDDADGRPHRRDPRALPCNGFLALLAVTAADRWSGAPSCDGAERKVTVSYRRRARGCAVPGETLLEISRRAGMPHMSVCGGRGRCSTCRVMVLSGRRASIRPSLLEAATLEAIRPDRASASPAKPGPVPT